MISARRKLAYWLHEKYAFMKIFLIFLILLIPILLRTIRIIFTRKYVDKKRNKDLTVGFFHPYCNACTPLENVLWSAVKAIQKQCVNVQICIYTGDLGVSSKNILETVESKFDIKLQPNIKFVYLHQRKWLKSFAYLGSMWVACEALILVKPHIMIDTMGYGFVNFIFKFIGGCKVINYVHNPIVTIEKLKTRHVILSNNQYVVTRRSAAALGISKAIAVLYGVTGRKADVIMVNSKWTEENINFIWKCPKKTHVVYPPIGLEKLMSKADTSWDKKNLFQIVNASEFREENNHEIILRALHQAKFRIKAGMMSEICLVLINLSSEQDEAYIYKIKTLIRELDLENFVKIYQQCVSSTRLEEELVKATYGIYAKADDNFGSDIIAGLASGQIMIVHNSGAAKTELINVKYERNGFLAKTVDEYSQALVEAFKLPPKVKIEMQRSSRRIAERFSRVHFQTSFLSTLKQNDIVEE